MLAVWQWWDWLLNFVPADRQLLLVNWDETACRLHHSGGKGFCSRRSGGRAKRQQPLAQSVTTAKKRGSLTHVPLICNDSAVRPLLPQVVVGNEHTLTRDELTAISERGWLVKCRKNLTQHLANLDAYHNELTASQLRARILAKQKAFALERKPFKRIAAVQQFIAMGKRASARRPFLVLDGPSRMGKTQFVQALALAKCWTSAAASAITRL